MQNAPIGRSTPVGPLLTQAFAADAETRTLLSGPSLPEVVRVLASTAEGLGYGALLGASPAGHNLVGAMSLASPELRPWTPGQDARVLVVDAVVAGAAGLLVAASHAHALGASETDALVVSMPVDVFEGVSGDSLLRRIGTLRPDLSLVA